MSISVRKGLVWLFIATIAQVPSAVRLADLLHLAAFLLFIAMSCHRYSYF